jgi:hypothetical protein
MRSHGTGLGLKIAGPWAFFDTDTEVVRVADTATIRA